jgi:hypothetical protein
VKLTKCSHPADPRQRFHALPPPDQPTGEQGAASATAADFAADAVGEKAGPLGAQGAEAADATKEAASRAADEVSLCVSVCVCVCVRVLRGRSTSSGIWVSAGLSIKAVAVVLVLGGV